jgi:AbrB family looped-hinge helix DNA binding protein
MTFGAIMATPKRKLARVQEKGQVTLPADVRRRLGLKKGNLVTITEVEDGILISPSEGVATRALDRIGRILAAQGTSLEELIESGRDVRGELISERYGLDPNRPTA